MELFDFPYHTIGEKPPESSARVKYGRGYTFASAPRGPDQIEFNLSFETMVFFEQARGILDLSTQFQINMGLLVHFYEVHRLYKEFIYPHPFRGDVVCRFQNPLEWKLKTGGLGSVEPFNVTLVLQP